MSSPLPSPSTDIAFLRRNGRQPACEPCRKRKVGCDHQLPICSRCKDSDIANSCTYIVRQSLKARRSKLLSIGISQQTNQPERPMSSSELEPFTPPTNDEAFLGVTSYRYAMREAQSKMVTMLLPEEEESLDQEQHESRSSGSRLMCDERTYEAAMRVVRAIPHRTLAYELLKAHKNPNDGWSRLATQWLHDSLWQTFGDSLENRSNESLSAFATQLCDNSSKALHEDFTEPKEWIESFSGRNMRWEGLGMLFTQWSFGAMALRQGPECSKYPSDNYNTYILRYKYCAWDSIEITRNTASANTLLLCLMYRQACLESNITGDDSLQHLRLHGETMSLMTYLGLHVTGGDSHDRGICTQIKRRLFGKIFHSDKVVSTFAGWPPVLSQRFTSTLLPLDISDEVLLGILPWNDNIVDEEGWNTLGEIYSSTLLRARAHIGFIREIILNYSLQNNERMNRQELVNLGKKQQEIMTGFPLSLTWNPDDVDNRDVSGSKLYAKLLIQLEYLQNIFFIERLLNKIDSVILSPNLTQISLQIVSLTLILWTHKDRMAGLHQDFEWLVIGFASPAAGILCLELLRPFSDKVEPNVSRSDLIQKLSLLSGFLSWIQPLTRSRKLTFFVRRVIERVLDQTLNYQENLIDSPMGMLNWGAEMRLDTNDFSFDLLDTFDWLRPEADAETTF